MSKNQPGTVEKNSSTIGPPAGIELMPLRCRCNALTTELRRYLTRASVIIVYFMMVMPANRFEDKSIKIL